MEEEREEDGGLTVTRFVWVEKVPFTVETDVRMCSDPSTSTIVFDIRPYGRMFEGILQPLSFLLRSVNGSTSEPTDG